MAEKRERIAVILDFITRGSGKAQATLTRLEKSYTTASSRVEKLSAQTEKKQLRAMTAAGTAERRQAAYRKQRTVAERAGAGVIRAEGLHAMGMGPRPDALREVHMRETAQVAEKEAAFKRARGIKETTAASSVATKTRLKDATIRQDIIGNEQVAMMGFNSTMGLSWERWQKFNKAGRTSNTVGGKAANRFRMMTHGLRGFKMELLSVMFFGMAMQKMFMGLLQPAMQVSGVFEVWGATMQILFLPTAMMVLGWVISLMEWVGSLTEEQQGLINRIVQVGAVLGTLLMIIGTVGLGIGGMIVAFSSWAKALGWMKGGIIKFAKFLLMNPIGIALLLIVGAIVLVRHAWSNNLGRIRQKFAKFVLFLHEKMAWVKKNILAYILHPLDEVARKKYQLQVELDMQMLRTATAGWIMIQDEIDATRKAEEAMAEKTGFLTNMTNKLNETLGIQNETLEDGSAKYQELADNITASMSVQEQYWATIGTGAASAQEKVDRFNLSMQKISGVRGAIGPGTFIGPGGAFTGGYGAAHEHFYGTPAPMARGGVVTSPTLAMIGERGPEAVIPLGRAGGMGGADNRTINITISPTINITEEIKSDVDMKRIKDELSDDWVRDIEARLRGT